MLFDIIFKNGNQKINAWIRKPFADIHCRIDVFSIRLFDDSANKPICYFLVNFQIDCAQVRIVVRFKSDFYELLIQFPVVRCSTNLNLFERMILFYVNASCIFTWLCDAKVQRTQSRKRTWISSFNIWYQIKFNTQKIRSITDRIGNFKHSSNYLLWPYLL